MNIEIKEYDNEKYRDGIEELADHYEKILGLLGEDPTREGLKKTPMRVAKAMQVLTKGYTMDAHKILTDALEALGLPYTGGKNAPYVWFRCPKGMQGWDFFDLLIDRARIVGTPGIGFGPCGEGWFRFSCFGTPEDSREAARRLGEIL